MTPWIAACQASLSFTIYQSLLRFMSIEWMMLSNHLILHCSLLRLPSIFPSIRVFSNESVLRHQVAKESNEYPGLIFFRIDLFAVQWDSQESSPAPQFESINSSALSLLYGSTLTSICHYWKNRSFHYMELCWQSI